MPNHSFNQILVHFQNLYLKRFVVLIFDHAWQASAAETYSVTEFLEDLSECRAKRIYVIADQSYSGLLAEALVTSESHRNVVVFASSGSTEYAWNGELTWQWVQANHTTQCVDTIYEVCVSHSSKACVTKA